MKSFAACMLALVVTSPVARRRLAAMDGSAARQYLARGQAASSSSLKAARRFLWRTPVAGGYAGPAVAEGRVFLMDYVTRDNVKVDNFDRKESSGTERVLCLDEATGEVDVEARVSGQVHDFLPGRAAVHAGGARRQGVCARRRGKSCIVLTRPAASVVWSKDFNSDYNTKSALWGYASHPLIDGDNLLCIVGGEGSHVVAFDKNTGEERWKALTSPEQGYSPPTIFEAGGVRQLILLRPNAVTSVDPATGDEYWSVPYEATSNSIIMAPVLAGDLLVRRRLQQQEPAAEAGRRQAGGRNRLAQPRRERDFADQRAAVRRGRRAVRIRSKGRACGPSISKAARSCGRRRSR